MAGYEIKSIGGKTLYVAKGKTVKEATVEAVKSGAYLSGADLRGADLRDADLRDAYLSAADLRGAYLSDADLSGADLSAADLRGAYLSGAYLSGADLSGADLRGADLSGAYLSGAYLSAAYLRGAYLRGAVLEKKLWTEVAEKLEISLKAMNDGGKHWIQGQLNKLLEDGSTAYCSVGSVNAHVEDQTVKVFAIWLLSEVSVGGIEAFNDHPTTTWQDIQDVFNVAIKHAKRFAT